MAKAKQEVTKPSKGRGRPKSIDFANDKFAKEMIIYMSATGATNDMIADKLGVCVATVNNYFKENPEFLDAVNKEKEKADAKVEAYLYKICTGEAFVEETIEGIERGMETNIKKRKQLAPAPGMLQLYLGARNPEKYRNNSKVDVEVSGELKTQVQFYIPEKKE